MDSSSIARAGDGALIASQLAVLAEWCLGPTGRAAAAAQLRKVGLPGGHDHVDDLCQDVLMRVYQRISRSPLDEGPGKSAVEAYATTAFRNAAVDLVRRGSSEGLEILTDPTLGYGFIDQAEPLPAADEPEGWEVTDAPYDLDRELRWLMHGFMRLPNQRLQAWTLGAALVTITLAEHEELELLPDIAVPDPNSPAAQAGAIWAGLGYAGRSDCFDQPETGAVRERRSQALQRVRSLITDALAEAKREEPQ